MECGSLFAAVGAEIDLAAFFICCQEFGFAVYDGLSVEIHEIRNIEIAAVAAGEVGLHRCFALLIVVCRKVCLCVHLLVETVCCDTEKQAVTEDRLIIVVAADFTAVQGNLVTVFRRMRIRIGGFQQILILHGKAVKHISVIQCSTFTVAENVVEISSLSGGNQLYLKLFCITAVVAVARSVVVVGPGGIHIILNLDRR